MDDRIIYKVVSKGGGMDGMDHTDKGGKIKFASFSYDEALAKVTPWDTLEKEVLEFDKAKRLAMKKLDGVDKLVLDLNPKTLTR